MDLLDIIEEVVSLTVPFNGRRIKLKYRLGELDDEFYNWAGERDAQTNRLVNSNLDVIERVVASWDLTIGGEPVEVKAEVLRSLENVPSSLWNTIANAIIEDSSPKSMMQKPSRGSSARKGGSARN